MLRYILFRFLQVIPVLLGTTFLIYFMVFAMPGNPVLALFGDKTPSPAVLEQITQQYNLDKPFIVQYFLYLTGIFRGDLGLTFSGQPVTEVLASTFPVTIQLALMAIVIELVLAISIGLISGLRKGKFFDNISLIIGLIMMSVPIFVIAFIGQYFLGIKWSLFRTTVGPGAPIQDLILPAIVLGISLYATSMRLTRASVIDTLNQDFVRTAYSKGLSRNRVIPVHVLRNSLIPTITNTATNFGVLMVGATVTEGIFNVPGVGNTLFKAIKLGENTTVVSFVTVMVLVYLFVNLFVDLLYAVLDPRIRYA
ncbi:oligopeptide transport system permease protein [Leucobacter luti]|uniref:Oligopeptide transport system permease protein n=1 Tax=Leucobacter luti TaxID=340320 RepID=A0A4R6S7S0_9MICO|nr:ABC transporter permease [Leucobacter luti]MCW2288471.1 oligopeptide transport system permease protein [Leucobacter luti]TCK45373.1 oligopeptide transport system permease protein [Leucobacter luti]TDP95902.1 oligopeptide transport system permease protein [Leucobacter luti]